MKKTIYQLLHAALVGPLLIATSLTLAAQTTPDISTPEAFLQFLRANRQNVALASFSLRANGSIGFDAATVRDSALLMAGVITGTFISADVSTTMRNFLEQPLAFELLGETDLFTVVGEKTGGCNGGFITNASYTIAKAGDYAGKCRITVLFQRLIPGEMLTDQFTTLIPFRFESKLARERMFALQVRRAFPLY